MATDAATIPPADDTASPTIAGPALTDDATATAESTPARTALSGAEKTALLLLLLEEPEAAALLARLAPDQVEKVGRAMLSVAEASPTTIDDLLDEVLEIARDIVAVSKGPETVRGLLDRALGDNVAAGMRERIGAGLESPRFERLDWLEPYAIASLIEIEHPQVQAIILTQMPESRAAQVLAALPKDTQPDLVRRIATLGPVMPTVLDLLDEALSARMVAVRPRQPIADIGGIKRAAGLINMAGIDEEVALNALAELDPSAGDILKETLFTFEDLAALDEKSLQGLVRALDAELLVPALRGADETLRGRIFSAMPQRAAESLQDEIENRGPVKIEDAIAAQKEIAATARRLAAEGELSLPGKGPAYV